MKKKWLSYVGSLAAVMAVSVASQYLSDEVFSILEHSSEHELLMVFFIIGCLFVLSTIVFYISHISTLPSFVVAIFFGIAGHNFLEPLVERHAALGAIVGFGATLILFGGGLDTPFASFRKLFAKIMSLSFFGLLLTAFLFSVTALGIASALEKELSVVVAVLLGAVLASTDPAAIIPVLKRLRFKNRATKDLIVSESAVTDVTGTLLTVVFLSVAITGITLPSVSSWYSQLVSSVVGVSLVKQLGFGVVFGLMGYACLELLQRFKKGHEREFEADSAFFLFIPVIIFTIALAFGGSGYLAAFIAGLLFSLTEHLHQTERFFNHLIDGFFKPTIFILLGALVDIGSLISYAWVGIATACVFMFVIRPIAVFLTLGPFSFFGKDRFTLRELLFISFVRETGAIPAVLLVTIVSLNLPGMSGLVPIGMWVILLTLIVEPILTPAVARFLKVAEPMVDVHAAEVGISPVVVLGTRGRTFIERLPHVMVWAEKHAVRRIVVLLCLEDKYSKELEKEILSEADQTFKKLQSSSAIKIDFSCISRTGFLQDNISELAHKDTNVTAIFVGRKMLDYRLDEIKQLSVPIFFLA